MKAIFQTLVFLFCFATLSGQKHDLTTVDGLMNALYSSISGPAGERDWDFFRSLYKPNAIMGAMAKGPDGNVVYRGMTPDSYIERNGPFFKDNGFWEEELSREVMTYGELAQVFSSYEFRAEQNGQEIRQRGINSIQIVFEDARWWIVSLQWNAERPELPLPESYRG